MSPQTSYAQNLSQALAGMRVNADPGHVISRTAQEVTPFGVALESVVGVPDQARAPFPNVAVILDDAGTFTAGNIVSVVCGVTVTTAFNSAKDQSMTDHAAAIQALDFITTAVYTSGSHTITITAASNVNLVVTTDVSGITGTMTITSTTYDMAGSVLGISVRDTIEAGSSRVEVNDRAVATLSGDVLNTSDTVAAIVNGVAATVVTYATSEAVTLQLVANAIKTIDGVADAVINSTLRTITVTMHPGLPLDSLVLTIVDNALGAVIPVFAIAYTAQGVSIGRNVAEFAPTETIPVLRKGEIWAQCEEAMTPASSVFVRLAPTTSFGVRGRLRTDTDSGTAIAASAILVTGNSITDPNGQLIVPVELNLP